MKYVTKLSQSVVLINVTPIRNKYYKPLDKRSCVNSRAPEGDGVGTFDNFSPLSHSHSSSDIMEKEWFRLADILFLLSFLF